MTARRMRVPMQELLDALEERSEHIVMYFDQRTGKVEMWVHPDFNDCPQIDPDDPDLVAIPSLEPSDAFRCMERFIDSLEEADVQRQLRQALAGKSPFRRFREVLHGFPDLRPRWDAAHRENQLQHATAFLASLGIEPIYELPPLPSHEAKPTPPARLRITLTHVLLLGSPNGKTELIEGRVYRSLRARSVEQARKQFEQLVREVMEWHGLAWRRSAVDGLHAVDIGDFHVRVDRTEVTVATKVTREIWDAFRR